MIDQAGSALRPGPDSSAGGIGSLPRLALRRVRDADVRPAAAWVLAIVFFLIYAALQPGTLSVGQIGTLAGDGLALATLALGQGIVILTAGIDLSVGGILSLGTALAATQFHGTGSGLTWGVVILGIGIGSGAANGFLIGWLGLQPFIVTLATWSIFDGIALIVLPTQGGSVPEGFAAWIGDSTAGLPNAIWAFLVLAAAWLWFRRTRLARRIYALGSDPEGAKMAGVSRTRTVMAAYMISGLCAAIAALFYAMQTASGDPTAGDGLILPSVAAVVIGGTALFGGQGGFIGTIAGVITLTTLGDVIFAFNLPSYWTVLADGLLLILAVLAGGGLHALQQRAGRRSTS
ncbi:MAG TPA: ABC transporter permease [Streptosporangiaceae bacterium]|jgi:ribose transport system permease protein|nr:ABC transporter permease [Streptosporangiaceae bacterium]